MPRKSFRKLSEYKIYLIQQYNEIPINKQTNKKMKQREGLHAGKSRKPGEDWRPSLRITLVK